MKANKTTKKALLLSVVSLLICCAMLAGTTFAWFSDEATSGKNQIVAGNLDVELYKGPEGNTVLSNTDALFGDDLQKFLWEPGAMWYSEQFRVANVGSLALTYVLDVVKNTKNDTEGYDGEITVSLLDVVKYKIVAKDELDALEKKLNYPTDELEKVTPQQRQELWNSITATDGETVKDMTSGVILPKDKEGQEDNQKYAEQNDGVFCETTTPLVVVLYWQPGNNDFDNQYNMKNDKQGKVTLKSDIELSVYATQTPYEDDTFGPNYDANAIAQHAVYSAVTGAVDDINDFIQSIDKDTFDGDADKAALVNQCEMSAFAAVDEAETPTYESTFQAPDGLKSDRGTIFQIAGVMTIKLEAAVKEQIDNISSVSITGNQNPGAPVEITPDGMNSQGWLLLALAQALTFDGMENGVDLSVAVTDAGGTTITYVVHFEFANA